MLRLWVLTYTYIYNQFISARKMMSFAHNDWGQREIINNVIILTKRVADTIYTVIPTKYHKYPSTTIIKQEYGLAKVNKPPYGRLLKMKPHKTYIITINVRTTNMVGIIH